MFLSVSVRLHVCVIKMVHVRKRGIEWESLLFPSLVSVRVAMQVILMGVHEHAHPCQHKHVQSGCVVVFVRYCPPTGYLYREHDIKRDR